MKVGMALGNLGRDREPRAVRLPIRHAGRPPGAVPDRGTLPARHGPHACPTARRTRAPRRERSQRSARALGRRTRPRALRLAGTYGRRTDLRLHRREHIPQADGGGCRARRASRQTRARNTMHTDRDSRRVARRGRSPAGERATGEPHRNARSLRTVVAFRHGETRWTRRGISRHAPPQPRAEPLEGVASTIPIELLEAGGVYIGNAEEIATRRRPTRMPASNTSRSRTSADSAADFDDRHPPNSSSSSW
jgi:hypothetical protein